MEEKEFIYDSAMDDREENPAFFDTSEKILALSDKLAEEIIFDNIKEQLEEELDTINTRLNYVSLFKEKYSQIDSSDDCYDEEYMKDVVARLATLLGEKLKEKYGVELGEDLDTCTPETYLDDMETLYEFLFIRQYTNLVDYIYSRLMRNRKAYIEAYKNFSDTEEYTKDLFVMQSKKKFKNNDDVLVIHFLKEIIQDILDTTTSSYDLFEEIVNLDLYEEFNNKMHILLENYGNKIVLNEDSETAVKYLSPLKNPLIFSEIRNAILIKYLESCDLDD